MKTWASSLITLFAIEGHENVDGATIRRLIGEATTLEDVSQILAPMGMKRESVRAVADFLIR